MKIQILSDIHLEFYNSFSKTPSKYVIPNADVLALVGDIGYPGSSIYRDFLAHVAQLFEHVIVITGNHEYYCTNSRIWDADDVDKYLKELVKEWPNVHYLYDSKVMINGYKFLGTTLWSELRGQEFFEAEMYMNDYRRIYYNVVKTKTGRIIGIPISPEHTVRWHREAVAWLREEFEEKVPTIVLTHHAPSIRPPVIDPTHTTLRSAYATDLEDLIPTHVALWAYGHTHHAADFIANNGVTRFVNNPFGYKGQFQPQIEHFTFAGQKYWIVPDVEETRS